MSEDVKHEKHVVDGRIAHSLVTSTEMIVGGDPRPMLMTATAMAAMLGAFGPAIREFDEETVKSFLIPLMQNIDRAIATTLRTHPRYDEFKARRVELEKLKVEEESRQIFESTPISEGH